MGVALAVMVVWGLFLAIGLPMMLASGSALDRQHFVELAERLENGHVNEPSIFTALKVEGRLNGRDVRVGTGSLLQYEVKVRHGLGDVILGRDDLRARLKRMPTNSAQALEAKSALQHLIGRLGIFMFILRSDGWLQVQRPGSSHAFKPERLQQVLEQLTRLVPLFESRAVQIKVLGGAEARAWTGGGESILCPFCRDTMSEDDLELTACPTCRTVHHTECFEEARGCTVFGCSHAPEKVRA